MTTIISLHNVPLPSGKTIREENLAIAHSFPLVTLVEVIPIPGFSSADEGLRLFIHSQIRDCNGAPLYTLTHDYRTIGRSIQPSPNDDEYQRYFSLQHRGAVTSPYGEDRLKVIKSAEELIPLLAREGYIFDGEKVISELMASRGN